MSEFARVRIGSLTLSSNLFLAPLAGYTNLPFRLVLRELGGLGLATTDLVNARSLIEKNPKALKLIETSPDDRPLSIQLFGSVPEEMRDAAAIAEAMGASVVDINMGCPVRKVCHVGGGSAMMIELDKTAHLAKGMIDAVKIPVTAKMRLGWDEENLTAPNLARALADVGIAAITVHGRTRAQGFGGGVNLAGIRSVVEAVPNLPIIGNGDVTSPEAARKMRDETGCAGIAMGRGAFYNPWDFSPYPALPSNRRAASAAPVRGANRCHAAAPGLDDSSVWRNTCLPDVPKSGSLVCPLFWSGPGLQPAYRDHPDSGRFRGGLSGLSGMAKTLSGWQRGAKTELSTARDG